MPAAPALSVLMPVYNAQDYVQQAVESILNQTFRDFEFIIINDGSTDKSPEILNSLAASDQRIRLISRENKGLVNTLNEGLALAQAPLIARMDADDVAFPDRFARQVEFLQHHPEVVCVGGYYEMIDESGRALALMKVPENDAQIQDTCLKGQTSINHPAATYRKAQVEAIGGYRPECDAAEDLDLWLRLGEVGQLANIAYPVIQYRFLTSSISGKQLDKQRQSAFNACQQAWQRRKLQNYQFEYVDWRPANDDKAIFNFHLKFGWWAFSYRQRKTALIYGLKAVSVLPLHLGGWRLLFCAVFKPLPDSWV